MPDSSNGTENPYKMGFLETFVFTVPDLRYSISTIILAGVISACFLLFSNQIIPNKFLASITGLALMPVAVSELWNFVMKDFLRKWCYFLSSVNQILFLLAAFLGYFLGLRGTELLCLAVGAVLVNSLEVLLISRGLKKIYTSLTALSIVILAYIVTSFVVGVNFYLTHIYSFSLPIAFLICSAYASRSLVKLNMDLDGFEFTSALAKGDELSMDVGKKVSRPIQKLKINNETSSFEVYTPWLHPGLIAGIGGGRITSRIIHEANQDGEGFFLHFPSTHRSDLAKPSDIRTVIEESPDVDEYSSEASELKQMKLESYTLYGRRYRDFKLVFIHSVSIDDYSVEFFEKFIDDKDVILVDCHSKEPSNPDELKVGTAQAVKLRQGINNFLSELEETDLERYQAGFKASTEGMENFALVEKVGEERTGIVGFNANDLPEETLRSGLRGRFDNLILLSTDDHHDPREIDLEPSLDQAKKTVKKAEKNISSAEAGLSSRNSPMLRILGDDYISLVKSFNIVSRLFFVTLAIAYLILIAVAIFL